MGRPEESRRSSDRRVDALVLPEHLPSRASKPDEDLEEADRAIPSQPVELIEAKALLDLDAIGQLLCGAAMFEAKYPHHGSMTLTAVVGTAADSTLRWCCDEAGVDLVELGEVWRAD